MWARCSLRRTGCVIKVERTQDPYGQREAILISVFMNVFNVHSNRSPVDGRIEQIQYFPGKFFNADLDKASTENERNAIVLTTTGNQTVTFVQVAGLIARRILCYVKAGDVLARGQRYGFIRFGSRVDVLPAAGCQREGEYRRQGIRYDNDTGSIGAKRLILRHG